MKSGIQRKFNPKNWGYSSKQPWNILDLRRGIWRTRECSVFKKSADENNKYQNGNSKHIMPFHERRHLKTSAC